MSGSVGLLWQLGLNQLVMSLLMIALATGPLKLYVWHFLFQKKKFLIFRADRISSFCIVYWILVIII